MADGIWASAAKRMGIPLWGQILIVLLLGLIGGAIWPIVSAFQKLNGFESRLEKVQSAVTALANQSPLHDLIKELLADAKSASASGDSARAQKAVDIAHTATVAVRAKKLPANPSFFQDSIQAADAIPIGPGLANLKIALAGYRSALGSANVPTGSGPQQVTITTLAEHGIILPLSVIRSNAPPGVDTFNFGSRCPDGIRFSDLVLENGQQTLDCFHWSRIAFVNVHIIYHGGVIDLNDVYFINCTFDFAEDFQSIVHSTQLADGIALGLASIRIG